MTTRDLQRTDELVHIADVAVRVASQLRLWLKRKTLRDREAIEEGIAFLEEAVRGGQFIDTGVMVAGSSSLYPLTWSADIHFAQAGRLAPSSRTSVRYQELVAFLDTIKSALDDISSDKQPDMKAALSAATFFDRLGGFLGSKADNALRSPAGGAQLLHDRVSYQ